MSTSSMDAMSTSNNESLLNQLVLYAPLISTRRPSSSSNSTNSGVSRTNSARQQQHAPLRVPFSWESSPGVPKFSLQARMSLHDGDLEAAQPLPLPPKMPPGRRCHQEDKDEDGVGEGHAYTSIDESDGGDNEHEDIFSDALEKISTSEKFDLACRLSSFNDLALSENVKERSVHRSPSFIMNRFLPAANALADSSVRNDVHFNRRAPPPPFSSSYRLQKEMPKAAARVKHRAPLHARCEAPSDTYAGETRPELPSMACGLMLFFPWSFEPTVCGFRSPRADLSSSLPRKVNVKDRSNELSSESFNPAVYGFRSSARSRTPRPDLPSSSSSSLRKAVRACRHEQNSESFKLTGCGFKSPVRARTGKPEAAAASSPPRRSAAVCSDGWNTDVEDIVGRGGGGGVGGGGYVEKLSVKMSHAHGWGLPFLDTSRLRKKGARDVEKWKARATRMGIGRERSQKRNNVVVPAESSRRSSAWRLPQLPSPSESSWLSHALNTINRRH